jgi:hypothetical protein
MKRLLLLASVVATAIALPAAATPKPAAKSPVVLSFTKQAVSDDLYVGTIDDGGTIEVMILDRRYTDSAQYLSAIFRVNVGDKWFAAVLHGSLDFATLETHLKGEITYGNWLQGASVREEGKLIGSDPYTFTGTLSLKGGDD